MDVLPIVLWPEPWLNQPSEAVLPEEFGSEELLDLIRGMTQTFRELGGVGLAAPQVGVHKQVIVLFGQDGRPQALCNPVIVSKGEGTVESPEGCLSLPGVTLTVPRATAVEVAAKAPDGSDLAFEAKGMLAIALQHEVDHLLGITIADGVGKTKGELLKRKMKKAMKRLDRSLKEQRDQYKELHSIRKEIRAKAPEVKHDPDDYAVPEKEKVESDHVVADS